nr:oligosaccharide flippase family protein [Pedobacter panaciterrae]
MPILARWFYGPASFGSYATFMAITAVIVNVASGKYENAVILPRTDRKAFIIVRASILLALASSIFTFIVIVVFNKQIIRLFSIADLGVWIYFIPLSVFLTSYNQIITFWYIRVKDFRGLSVNRVLKAGSNASSNVVVAFFIKGGGLIMGNILGNAISSISMYFKLRSTINSYWNFKRKEIYMALFIYRKFPLFIVPSEFLNVLSSQLPVFVIGKYFGNSVLGAFSFVVATLGIPITLLSNSLLDVFKERATNDYRLRGNCKEIYIKTLRHLLILSLPVFIILYLTSPWLCKLLLGEKWSQAGDFTQILSIMYFFKFISSPLSYTFIIADKMKEDFLWHIYIAVSLLIGLLSSSIFFKNVETVLWVFSINFSFVYTIYLLRSYSFAKGNLK